jgi:DNA-binding NarL/FixJ family response regulator
MIRVFLVDDHEIVREGLRKVLQAARDMQIVGEARNGREALQALESETSIDVVVLDLSLPDVGGLEVLRRARQLRPMTQVLVLTMYAEEQYADRLRAMGAAAYLSKSQPAAEVLKAIRTAAGGRAATPEAPLPEGPPSRPKAPHDTLSVREYQVFMLLLQGRAVGDIAAELNVTSSTVSNHLTGIRTKLGVRTVADIVRYAARERLINERVIDELALDHEAKPTGSTESP